MRIFLAVAFAMLTVFYGIYFAKQVAMRSTGIRPDRLGRGEKPRRVLLSERVLAAVTVLTAVGQYVTLLSGGRFLLLAAPHPAWQVAGSVVGTVGVLYFAVAVSAMKTNWRAGIDAGERTELVETGIYRFSRNPAFVGFDLLYAGFAMMWPSWPVIVLSVAAAILLHLQVLHEEEYLTARFGEAYRAYRRRTLRY